MVDLFLRASPKSMKECREKQLQLGQGATKEYSFSYSTEEATLAQAARALALWVAVLLAPGYVTKISQDHLGIASFWRLAWRQNSWRRCSFLLFR